MENTKTSNEDRRKQLRGAAALIRKLGWASTNDAKVLLAAGNYVLHPLRDGGFVVYDLEQHRKAERATPLDAFLEATHAAANPSCWGGLVVPTAAAPKRCPECSKTATDTADAVMTFGTRIMQRKPFEMRWQSQCSSCRSTSSAKREDEQAGLF